MLKRRLLYFFLVASFILPSVCVTASAHSSSVNGVLFSTDWIVDTPNPYLTSEIQYNSVVRVVNGFSFSKTARILSRWVSSGTTTTFLDFDTSGNNQLWSNPSSPPFPGTSYTGDFIIYPRLNSIPSFPDTPQVVPYSYSLTLSSPAAPYRGLTLSFSKLQTYVEFFAQSYRTGVVNPVGTSYSTVSDTFLSLTVNGKILSTVRYDGKSSPFSDKVTIDVTNKDVVSLVFSFYPPTTLVVPYTEQVALEFRPYFKGYFSKPTLVTTTSPYTEPVQAMWWSPDKPPSSFDDGFTNGVPGDYDPGSGGGGGGDNSAQLTEIQNSLTELGTSLTEYNQRVEQIATDVATGLDKVDQSIKDSTDTIMGDDSDPNKPTGIKGIIASILNLPKLILDGIVSLFVPSAEDVIALLDKFSALLENMGFIGGFLSAGMDLCTEVLGYFSGAQPADVIGELQPQLTQGIVHFPGISFPMPDGTIVTIAEEQDVQIGNKYVDILRPVLSTIVLIICILAFINSCWRLAETVYLSRKMYGYANDNSSSSTSLAVRDGD